MWIINIQVMLYEYSSTIKKVTRVIIYVLLLLYQFHQHIKVQFRYIASSIFICWRCLANSFVVSVIILCVYVCMYTQVSVKETELSKSFASGVVRPVFFLFFGWSLLRFYLNLLRSFVQHNPPTINHIINKCGFLLALLNRCQPNAPKHPQLNSNPSPN